LIENLLTWSRIQQGTLDHYPQMMDLRELARQNVDVFMSNAEHKGITLKNLIEEKIPVYADVNMLNAILRHLISNALKFTKPGGLVEVSARDNGAHVEVSVSDTGIGISAEHLPKLFRIDVRYKRLGTAREKGTGFGLILCKEFIEKHGGKIWIESKVEQGSTVRFTLPKNPYL
jgi:two-component system sensor histidine kinase/response regulator